MKRFLDINLTIVGQIAIKLETDGRWVDNSEGVGWTRDFRRVAQSRILALLLHEQC